MKTAEIMSVRGKIGSVSLEEHQRVCSGVDGGQVPAQTAGFWRGAGPRVGFGVDGRWYGATYVLHPEKHHNGECADSHKTRL